MIIFHIYLELPLLYYLWHFIHPQIPLHRFVVRTQLSHIKELRNLSILVCLCFAVIIAQKKSSFREKCFVLLKSHSLLLRKTKGQTQGIDVDARTELEATDECSLTDFFPLTVCSVPLYKPEPLDLEWYCWAWICLLLLIRNKENVPHSYVPKG